jgi:iron complex transport system substrate-binding protein
MFQLSPMRKLLTILVAIAWVLPAWAEIAVRDDSGLEVRLPKPATRIVSLAPNITETLFAAGAGDRLVGTVEYSDYPAAAKRIRQVGSYANLNPETILALKPDLVIAWQSGNPATQN